MDTKDYNMNYKTDYQKVDRKHFKTHNQLPTGGNDPTLTNSRLLSNIVNAPSKQASTIPYTDGALLANLTMVSSTPTSLTIHFNYFSASFTKFTAVATPIASILPSPLPVITQNIPISDSTGCTDISKNNFTYTITGLSQGTQYQIALSATNYFKLTTTLVYPNVATNQPPDPPTNVSIVALSDYSADITFTPPIQIIATYVANVYSGSDFLFSQRFSVPPGTRVNLPLTVTGLNFNVYYTITFFAINSDGLSLGSVPLTFKTPQIPDAPTNVFSPAQTNVSIDISFNPPAQYVQYYTLVAYDICNNQVFNQNIVSSSNLYRVTGLIANRVYTINVYSYNTDGQSPTYAQIRSSTLATIVSANFGQIGATSIQLSTITGSYTQLSVQRNIGAYLDGSFNLGASITNYTDTQLNENTQYTYSLTPVNAFGISGIPLVLAPKYTYAGGFIRDCTNIGAFNLQVNFIGYYTYAMIQRNGGTLSIGGTNNNYPNSSSPQTSVSAYVVDTSLNANSPYTYTVTIYNGDGVPTLLSSQIGATTLSAIYTASFGAITNGSIQITNLTGSYSKITVIRTGGTSGTVTFDINNLDTSANDIGLNPNTLYTYILTPYAINTNYSTTPPYQFYLPGIQYNALGSTYTRPTLTSAAFASTTYNSISINRIAGIFDRVRIVRTTQGISGATATYDISNNISSITDTSGLNPNTQNSFVLTSYNPNNLTGDIINLGSIYTDASGYILPCIATSISTLYLQWVGYDSSVSIIRSGGGTFTPISAQNYPISTAPQSFLGGYVTDSGLVSNLPYTYTVTLYNGNAKPTVITTTIGNTTLPQITAASFGTITINSQVIQGITGNYTTAVINQTNLTTSTTTNGVATISSTTTTIPGLTPNNNYTYSLIPFNGVGVSGAIFNMTSLYTLPTLTAAAYGAFSPTSLVLQGIVGSYYYVKVDRYATGVITPSYNIITINYPSTGATDLSLNPNSQYTYYFTPYNPNNTAGAVYTSLGYKYTDISAIVLAATNISTNSAQLNWKGTYSNVTITRNLVGSQFIPSNYTTSYAPQNTIQTNVVDVGATPNVSYNYTFTFTNGNGLTNVLSTTQTLMTLPAITSIQYIGRSYNSLYIQLAGLYYQYAYLYRVDISNNTSTQVRTIVYPDSSYNDTGLSPNYQYQYVCVPYNANNVAGPSITSYTKYTDASGVPLAVSNITTTAVQLNWAGYYSYITITRNVGSIVFGSPTAYFTTVSNISSPLAQTLLTGYINDQSVVQNTAYTYTLTMYNGDGVATTLSPLYFTNFPTITSTPAFGTITSTSISIVNVVGVCSNITINRFDVTGLNTKSYDVSYANILYDTSINFTNSTIPYDASYTYTLTPKGTTGVSGQTIPVPGVIYTLPILYNVSYGVVDTSSIQINLFTGSYEYIQVDRYYGANTIYQTNAFRVNKGVSSVTDALLLPDASYSYNFTPYNLSVPNVSGGAIKLPSFYTKPYLPGAIYQPPIYTSIGFDVSSSVCTSITINRYKNGGVFDTSYDVPYASTIYDTSFVNNTVPYDTSYTYLLTPKNRIGTYGTSYGGLGTIYTLPLLTSATFGTVSTNSIPINVAGTATSITINRTDAAYGINTLSYDVSFGSVIYDNSVNFVGRVIPPDASYSYTLTPKNRVGIAGSVYNGPGTVYSLPVITSATFGPVSTMSIPINVTGTGTTITINRTDPNTTNTKSYDVSFAPVIYDNSVNFVGGVIPYGVNYTYTLTPKNRVGAISTVYTGLGQIYTLPVIVGALYKTPTYQTIPIDVSSSVGLTPTITVSRYLAGGIFDVSFDVSYASTILDVSGTFAGQSIPYNTAYTYKLSPKNQQGVYGADVSLNTIYTLPLVLSAAYKTPTSQTIPIDISSSVATCSNIIVNRYKPGNVLDTSFVVATAATIYDVSGNFTGNSIPPDVSYTYKLGPLNAYGLSGTLYTGLGTIYTLPTLNSASYGTITQNSIQITLITGSYEYINITRNVLDNNNNIVSSVPNALQITSPKTTSITDTSGITGLQTNSNYSYTLFAYNGSGQQVSYVMPNVYTYAYGTVGTVTSTPTSATLSWSGIYSSITISRNDNGGSFTGIAYYPNSVFPQTAVNGSVTDTAIAAGTSYIYTLSMKNVQGIPNLIGTLNMTPSSGLASATYGTVTSSSIYLTGFAGAYSNIIVTRRKGAIFDTSYTVYYPDTSRNDTGLLADTPYIYTFLPFNAVGVSGSYYSVNNGFPIYTLPSLTNVVYTASANAINFSSITGSYSNISVNRYSGTTNQNTFTVISAPTSDTGLTPDTSYSYQFVPYGSGAVSLSGSIVNVPTSGVIYTLPGINSANFGTPSSTQIPINVSAICTSITIGRFDPNGINTSTRDVSNAAIIYDNSINFVGGVIPPDVSYTYTLTPKNKLGSAGTPFNVGVVYTIPTIYSATSLALDISSLQIVVTGSFESMLVNRYLGASLMTSNTYTKSQFPIKDTNLFADTGYNYSLLPLNGSIPSISGNYYTIPTNYTYGNISSAAITTINNNTLNINSITGNYHGIYYQRTGAGQTVNSTISTPVTGFTDPSSLIPDTSYTYVISAINGSGLNNPNNNDKFTVSTYTDASGYINSFTDTSSSVTVYWSGYYNTATLMRNTISITPINTSNITSPADGTLVNGYATDNNGGVGLTPNSNYSYQLMFTNKNSRTIYTFAYTTYTLAYYSNASITDTSSSVTLTWTGYYSSIGPVYLNGTITIPDTSTNTLPDLFSSQNTGSITTTTNIKPNYLYYYDVSLISQDGVSLQIARQSAYTLAYYRSAGITSDTSSSIIVNWTGYYSSITPVYQGGTVRQPDTSTNTVITPANWGNLNTGSITIKGLSANSPYYYDLSLNNGNSVATGIARQSAYTLAYYSSAGITDTSSSVTVNWTGYYSSITPVYLNGAVRQPDTSTNTVITPVSWGNLNTGSVTIKGLTPNNPYYVDVSLNNGNAVPTGIVRQSTYTEAYGFSNPVVPIDVSAIQVNWSGYYSTATITNSPSVDAYTVKTNNYPNSSNITGNVVGNVYNTGLSSNTQYTYTITLKNANNNSYQLNTVTGYTYPAAPTITNAGSVTDKTCTLTFTIPSGTISSYNLTGGTLGTQSSNTFPVTELTSNSSNSLSLTAKNNTSGLTSVAATCTVVTLPSAPVFTAAAGVTSTTLTITKPYGTIDAYYFSGGDSNTVLGAPGSYTNSITTASLGPLTQNTSYTFKLSCKNNSNNLVSASGSYGLITDTAAPTAVVATTGSTNSTSVSWTNPTVGTFTSSNYSITGGGTVGTKTNAGTPITLLSPNTSYTFSVTVTGLSGNPSAAGSTSNFYTNPDKPTGLSATGTTTGANLSWTNPTGTLSSFTSSLGSLSSIANYTSGAANTATLTYSAGTGGSTYNVTITATNSTSGLTSAASDSASFTMVSNGGISIKNYNTAYANYVSVSNIYLIFLYTTVGTITNALDCTNINGTQSIQIFAVAGGGSGGGDQAGGGGAGGVISKDYTLSSTSGTASITVGNGGVCTTLLSGSSVGVNGENTKVTFTNDTSKNIDATGGGAGGSYVVDAPAKSGGSGGGAGYDNKNGTIGTGTTGQGNDGGAAYVKIQTGYGYGGGGGAGSAGGNGSNSAGGNGGDGIKCTLSYVSGTPYANYYWAGGGGGAFPNYGTGGSGGKGGGGGGSVNNGDGGAGDTTGINNGNNGGSGMGVAGGDGGANTGGGGGGSSQRNGTLGGKGGSGIVLIAIKTTTPSLQTSYYPLVSDIKNYVTGTGVTDATMGVGSGSSTATFSTTSYAVTAMGSGSTAMGSGSLTFIGSTTHNAADRPYVTLPTLTCTGKISFTCWFKSNYNTLYSRVFDFGSYFRLHFYGNDTSMTFNDAYTFSATDAINTNKWTFVAIVVDGTSFTWYINAGNTGNTGNTTLPNNNKVNISGTGYLGHSMGGDPEFAGAMQDVRFFNNVALTSTQVAELYAFGAARKGTS
jgi:hypothetical protein